MKFIALLLLFACSTTSIQDLEEELVLCIKGGYLCAELQEEIERKEKRQLEQEAWDAQFKCPKGYVFLCNGSWCSGRLNRWPTKAERFGSGCISRANLRQMLGW
jgi:hypothetical protein